MALFTEKDGSLNLSAICYLLIGGRLLIIARQNSDLSLLLLGALLLAVAIGSGLKKRWALWLECVAILAGLGLIFATGFKSWWAILGCLPLGRLLWLRIRELRTPSGAPEKAEKPLVSLVLLLSQPRYLDDKILAQIVESAWGGNYSDPDEARRDGFVAGNDTVHLIKSPIGMFLINNFPTPYWRASETLADSIQELRVRKCLQDHKAWLSVDLMGSFVEDPTHAASYAAIVRLLYEIADESVLAILRPETGTISPWTDDVVEKLLRPSGEETFHQASGPPVIPITPDDPEMLAAVAEARERWPEFTHAFQNRAKGDPFFVKAPVESKGITEHIWIEVKDLDAETVHGTLGNEPVNLEGLKLGSRVGVPIADIGDWSFSTGEGKIQGLFSVKVVEKRMQQSKEERPAS